MFGGGVNCCYLRTIYMYICMSQHQSGRAELPDQLYMCHITKSSFEEDSVHAITM